VKKFFRLLNTLIHSLEFYLFFIISLCVLFLIFEGVSPKNVQIKDRWISIDSSFPITQKMKDNERLRVVFDVEPIIKNAYSLRIIPDDCVEIVLINGQALDVYEIQGRCNFSSGLILDQEMLKPFLSENKTNFEIEVKNNGGPGGINVLVLPELSLISFLARIIFTISSLLFCVFLLRRLKTSFTFAFLLGIGVLVRVFFFLDLSYTQFAYDVDGHVEYIKLIAEHNKLPDINECWTCYHPPIYYSVSQPFWRMGSILSISETQMLQFQSLLFSILTLFFGFFCLKQFLCGKSLVLGSVLWCFWPTLILSAPRIGNDQFFYVTHIITLWLCIKYIATTNPRRGKYLLLAVIISALSYWTKSTGIISIGIMSLTILIGYFPRESNKPTKTELIAIIASIFLVASILLIKIYGNSNLVGNASGLHSGLRVGNEPANYLFFDIKDFIVHPYASPWEDAGGRQYFWNYLFKTSLFGEFKILTNQTGLWLATFINLSFLGVLFFAFRGWWKSKITKTTFLLMSQAIAFIAALFFLRFSHPYSCSNDFRYILPILLSLIPFVANGVFDFDTTQKWKVVGALIILTFAGSSVLLLFL